MLKRSGRSQLTKILFGAATLLIGMVFIASTQSSAANATKGQFQFEPLQLSAPCTPGGNANQPFLLPAGYGQTIIASEPQFPDLPDMTTLNENGNQAGRYLYRTHEVGGSRLALYGGVFREQVQPQRHGGHRGCTEKILD